GLTSSGLEERDYLQQDANWNVTSVYHGGLSERIIYDAYGTPLTLKPNWSSNADTTILLRPLFQGEYLLSEANVYIMGARMFDYTIGAWVQKDPIGYGDGMN